MSTTSLPNSSQDCNLDSFVTAHSGVQDAVATLPPNITIGMSLWAAEVGMEPEHLADGLMAARELTMAHKHRCAACFRWLRRGRDELAPVIGIYNSRFVIGIVCGRCERRWPDDELPAKMAPYLCGGEGADDE